MNLIWSNIKLKVIFMSEVLLYCKTIELYLVKINKSVFLHILRN